MKVLVVNCGSSSIKFQLYEMPQEKVLAKGIVERIGEDGSSLTCTLDSKTSNLKKKIRDHEEGMELILGLLVSGDTAVLNDITEIDAVGHRVVHGGEEFTGSVKIDEEVIASIEKFSDLAPLHNPPNLTGIRASMHKLPKVVQVACFDTAFHATIPRHAFTYALPYELYKEYRVRRYGFHGTSHLFVTRRAAGLLGKEENEINIITCHLGNGCSATAVKNGKSIDTSMGLTPLEGLVMGTRSGDFDPAILFYLADKGHEMSELKNMCNKKSGLLGISGVSNDMRNLIEHAEKGDKRSQLAIDIFCYRVKKYIGAFTAVLDTLDAVVFTGGIGEKSALIRSGICSGLSQVGIRIDPEINNSYCKGEKAISGSDSRVKVFVIPTNEEVVIAQDTFKLAERCNV